LSYPVAGLSSFRSPSGRIFRLGAGGLLMNKRLAKILLFLLGISAVAFLAVASSAHEATQNVLEIDGVTKLSIDSNHTETVVAAGIQGSKKKDATVYVTETGKKYHRAGCRYLRKSKIPISLKEAKRSGYTPCSVCKPPR